MVELCFKSVLCLCLCLCLRCSPMLLHSCTSSTRFFPPSDGNISEEQRWVFKMYRALYLAEWINAWGRVRVCVCDCEITTFSLVRLKVFKLNFWTCNDVEWKGWVGKYVWQSPRKQNQSTEVKWRNVLKLSFLIQMNSIVLI